MPLLFADNFLTGSLLTLLMPTILLCVIAAWYVREVKRVPKDIPPSATSLPSAETLTAAREATEEAAGPPPAAGS
jgi:cytochrome bd-type quinol oxidase subunit 1